MYNSEKYLKFYTKWLDIPFSLNKVKEISGAVENPQYSLFPPALLPFWVGGSGIVIGMWMRSCDTHKNLSVVDFYGKTVVGLRNVVIEKATSIKQLAYIELLEFIVKNDGLNEDVISFAQAFNLNEDDINKVLEVAEASGDDLAGLKGLALFSENLPLMLCGNGNYKGSFLYDDNVTDYEKISRYTSFEVHSGLKSGDINYSLREKVSNSGKAPAWLVGSELMLHFENFLKMGNYQKAWLVLNSSGWNYFDAKKSFEKFCSFNKNNFFDELYECWSTQNYRNEDGY